MTTQTLTGMSARARPASGAHARTATAVALGLIAGVAIALRFASFSGVYPNPFYDAAVRSMGLSWHNFFYGAFDPRAMTSVDKVPLDLWLQVASTKLFGFTGTALRLPEAVAGVLAVLLLFDVVRRIFGRPAGLASALVLAVLPLAVITSRSDTMDSLMVLCLLAAAWCGVRAMTSSSWLAFVGVGVAVGLAFNVKLFEALIVAPGLLLLLIVGTEIPWRSLLVRLFASCAAFGVVAMSWITAATLLPGPKPFAIGSTDGSVLNAVFVFDGVDRLVKKARAPGVAHDHPGVLRLVHTMPYDRLVGASLVAAVVIGTVALVFRLPAVRHDQENRMRLALGTFFATWLGVGIVLFSTVTSLRTRYLEAMTPAVAAVTGIALTTLLAAARRNVVPAVLLALTAAIVAILGTGIGQPSDITQTAALAGAGLCALAAALRVASPGRSREPAIIALAVGALTANLAVPVGASLDVIAVGASDSGRPGAINAAPLGALSAFLRAHQGSARYEVAAAGAFRAGPIIARDGRPVLILTTIRGRQIVSVPRLRDEVAAGHVRYLLVDAGCAHVPATCTPVVRWAVERAIPLRAAVHVPGLRLLDLRTLHRAGG